MYKWIGFYIVCLLIDVAFYEIFSPSIFLFQGVFLSLFIWRSKDQVAAKIFFTSMMSIIYGVLFQQNLGLLLLAITLAAVTHMGISIVQNKLDAELLLNLLLFNFLALGFVILGSRPSLLWVISFVITNFIIAAIIMLIMQRFDKNEHDFV